MSDNRRAVLRIVGPDIPQDTIEVSSAGITVGRLDANELTLKHSKVSRQHIHLVLTDEGLSLEDLGSSNGTYVGDRRLEPKKPEVLERGQSVRLGPFTLTYEDLREVQEEDALPDTQQFALDAQQDSASADDRDETLDTLPPLDVSQLSPLDSVKPSSSIVERPSDELMVPPSPPPPQIPGDYSLEGGNGKTPYDPSLVGIPKDASSYLNYLPGIFREDPLLGRFLIIPESINMPIEWLVDNFDMYLQPQYTPEEFLHWFAEWFDVYMPEKMPLGRKRHMLKEVTELYFKRGTPQALKRHFELVFDVTPEIEEPADKPASFTVTLDLGKDGDTEENREMAKMVIESQRPAHTTYVLTIR